jgi:hypothetical protein
MTKTTISIFSLCLILIGMSFTSNAQRRSNFRVDAPNAIQGYKIIEEMPDDGTWGTFINSKWENIPVAFDQNNANGCAAFAPGYFTGKFALIYRGGCEFGAKALAAQTAGATGVIIVNNLLGVAGMAAGANGAAVTIPVIMVNTQAGDDMKAQLLNNIPVSVSLTAWRYDSIANPIDIGFKNDGPLHPLGKAMPVSQLVGQADDSFRVYSGGIFYNYSVANFDTVNVQGRLDYKPTFVGGSFSPLDSNFINFFFQTPITTVDSALFLQLDTIQGALAGFDMNDAPKGTYRMDNRVLTVPFTETALSSLDNQWVYTFAVTDSIYSKCEYDFTRNAPMANHYINVNAANTYNWGPMFYIRTGSYRAEKAQVVVMRDVIDDSLFIGEEVFVELRKWDDANGNGGMDLAEVDAPIAQGSYALTANDLVPIAGLPITIKFDNLLAPGSPILLDANSKYWLTVELGGPNRKFTVGVDYYADYRANLNANVGQGNPLFDVTGQQVFGGGFANTGSPSIALLMSKDPEGINDIAKFDGEAKVYPNPATDLIQIALTLNKISSKVSYEIVDINGRSIATSSKSNIKSDNISFNTSKLSNGTYFVKIATESGKTQLKFTVSK